MGSAARPLAVAAGEGLPMGRVSEGGRLRVRVLLVAEKELLQREHLCHHVLHLGTRGLHHYIKVASKLAKKLAS